MIPLKTKDSTTAEGIKQTTHRNLAHCISSDHDLEPAIVAHVKLRDKITPSIGEDVTRKVEASIARAPAEISE